MSFGASFKGVPSAFADEPLPCATFDKWRAPFVFDDQYRVIDIVQTQV